MGEVLALLKWSCLDFSFGHRQMKFKKNHASTGHSRKLNKPFERGFIHFSVVVVDAGAEVFTS